MLRDLTLEQVRTDNECDNGLNAIPDHIAAEIGYETPEALAKLARDLAYTGVPPEVTVITDDSATVTDTSSSAAGEHSTSRFWEPRDRYETRPYWDN